MLDELKKLGERVGETVSQVAMIFGVRKLLQSYRLMKLMGLSHVGISPLSKRG